MYLPAFIIELSEIPLSFGAVYNFIALIHIIQPTVALDGL